VLVLSFFRAADYPVALFFVVIRELIEKKEKEK